MSADDNVGEFEKLASDLAEFDASGNSVKEEAEAVAACMMALARIPKARRAIVVEFLGDMLAGKSLFELSTGIVKHTAEELHKLRAENAQLRQAATGHGRTAKEAAQC